MGSEEDKRDLPIIEVLREPHPLNPPVDKKNSFEELESLTNKYFGENNNFSNFVTPVFTQKKEQQQPKANFQWSSKNKNKDDDDDGSDEEPNTKRQKMEKKTFTKRKMSFNDGDGSVKYAVLWAKSSTRKHKKWEDDGILVLKGSSATLLNLDNEILENSRDLKVTDFSDGQIIKMGGKEVEIQNIM